MQIIFPLVSTIYGILLRWKKNSMGFVSMLRGVLYLPVEVGRLLLDRKYVEIGGELTAWRTN